MVGENSVPPPRPPGARALLARRDGWKSANRRPCVRPCARDAGRLGRMRAASDDGSLRPATVGVSSNLLASRPLGRAHDARHGRARAPEPSVRRVAVKLLRCTLHARSAVVVERSQFATALRRPVFAGRRTNKSTLLFSYRRPLLFVSGR